ncbi:ribokinase [Allorhizobium terrae]|uniref:Ribokinase n=1 Tax=Allorhizobium terrae TaxID=1848972 RepID=A0A4S3ZXR1_9HYPH|nr:ribokinase [Allorhizobium terrae]THF50695.1 ribokinase [Allorhizobium terrae]
MITVFGSINMDLIATTTRLPKPGETVAGTGFATAAGGKGANQALAACRAGAQVKMAGAVGKDGFANDAVALLKDGGTDLSLVKSVEAPTGTALILVEADGENMIAVVPGANGTLTSADASNALKGMSTTDTLMLQLEIPAEAVETALHEARAAGIRTVINIAPLTDEAARLGKMADIVIANETEFERLAGESGMGNAEREAAMQRLHGETGQTLIVTLGAEGVMALHEGKLYRASGLTIEPVDTVGAGDTFCGYFTASLDAGLGFEDALKRAAIAGSLACLNPGAQPAIPMASDVAEKL